MTDGELRELCHAFLDAYEKRRPDALGRLYAEDCVIWHNVFGRETTGADNLERFADSYRGQRRRTYDDRAVDTFGDGFAECPGGTGGTGGRPTMRRDGETLQLCDRFFDSIERKDFDTGRMAEVLPPRS